MNIDFMYCSTGSAPYPGMGAREVMRRVRDGYRLERPSHCHPDMYKVITKCWAGDMNKRPDFTELRQVLFINFINLYVHLDILKNHKCNCIVLYFYF